MAKRAQGKENRPCLSLKRRKRTQESERFSFVSSSEVDLHKEKFIPENTDKATQWAVKVFTDWSLARQEEIVQVFKKEQAVAKVTIIQLASGAQPPTRSQRTIQRTKELLN